MASNSDNIVYAFSDGSAIGNPGPGGYGVVLKYGDNLKELSQGFIHTMGNRYVETLLDRAKMTDAKPVATPGVKDGKESDDTPLDADEHKEYRSIVGGLQWLAFDRWDLLFATK